MTAEEARAVIEGHSMAPFECGPDCCLCYLNHMEMRRVAIPCPGCAEPCGQCNQDALD